MIKLVTKNFTSIPTKRGIRNGLIYMSLDELKIDSTKITVIGKYYWLNQGQEEILDRIYLIKDWSDVEAVEEILSLLQSNQNLKINLIQRLTELTFLQLQLEDGQNYNTSPDDWQIL